MSQIGQIHVPQKRSYSQPKLLITKIAPGDSGESDQDQDESGADNEEEEYGDRDSEQEHLEHECDHAEQSDAAQSSGQPSPTSTASQDAVSKRANEDNEHEDIKPTKRTLFSCETCNATFVTSLSLTRHNMVYHEGQDQPKIAATVVKTYKDDEVSDEDEDDIQFHSRTRAQVGIAEDEDENEEDMSDRDGTSNYTHIGQACIDGGGGNEDEDMDAENDNDDQPEPDADPFAEDADEGDEDGGEVDGIDKEEEAYAEFDNDNEDNNDEEVGTYQNDLHDEDGNSLLYLNGNELVEQEERDSLIQFEPQHSRSLLRKPFNETRNRHPVRSLTNLGIVNGRGNGIQVQGQKAHICPECGIGFVTRVNMQRHMLSHGQDRPHKCQLCDKGFVRKEHLFKHLSSVHSGLKFTCEFCGKDISRKDHLLRHIRHVHPSEFLRIPPELLNAQNLESLSSASLRAAGFSISDKALNSMQPKPKKPYLNCDMCPATFTLLNDLYTHQSEVHSDIRKHKCPDCPKAFKRKEHLTKHEVLHSGDKKFSCTICGKSFPRKDALADHTRRLHGAEINGGDGVGGGGGGGGLLGGSDSFPEIEYPCNLCDKVFLLHQNLDRHLRNIHRISVNLPNQMMMIQQQQQQQQTQPVVASATRIPNPMKPMKQQQQQLQQQPARNSINKRTLPAQAQVQVRQQQQHQTRFQPKPILPKKGQEVLDSYAVNSLLQAQQHLNKISGGKSSITISAIPSVSAPAPVPASIAIPRQGIRFRTPTPAARHVPAPAAPSPSSCILTSAIKRPILNPTFAQPKQSQTLQVRPTQQPQPQVTLAQTNKIVIKKIGEYMKVLTPESIANSKNTTTGTTQSLLTSNYNQIRAQKPIIVTSSSSSNSSSIFTSGTCGTTQNVQSFPCSYCNAVYSDEKIFRIHMNSHNANMN